MGGKQLKDFDQGPDESDFDFTQRVFGYIKGRGVALNGETYGVESVDYTRLESDGVITIVLSVPVESVDVTIDFNKELKDEREI